MYIIICTGELYVHRHELGGVGLDWFVAVLVSGGAGHCHETSYDDGHNL